MDIVNRTETRVNGFSQDVSGENFRRVVIEGSYEKLVVVDFWAAWCAPCQMLKPVLEKLARDYQGAFLLAKVNTQEDPEIAQEYAIRGIPDVKFFKDGKVVAEFSGVRPAQEIERMLKPFVITPLQELLIRAQNSAEPLDVLRSAEGQFSNDSDFLISYAQTLSAGGAYEEALNCLQKVSRIDARYDEAQRLRNLLAFAQNASQGTDLAGQDDGDSQYTLAGQAYLNGDLVAAVEALLQLLRAKKDPLYRNVRDLIVSLIQEIPERKVANSLERRLSMLINS